VIEVIVFYRNGVRAHENVTSTRSTRPTMLKKMMARCSTERGRRGACCRSGGTRQIGFALGSAPTGPQFHFTQGMCGFLLFCFPILVTQPPEGSRQDLSILDNGLQHLCSRKLIVPRADHSRRRQDHNRHVANSRLCAPRHEDSRIIF
jgi:hypothetical protein